MPVTLVGAPGATAVKGVTAGLVGGEVAPVPATLIAATSNTYCRPGVRPVTVNDVAVLLVNTGGRPPLLANGVIWYPVIAEPPLSVGAVHDTIAELDPATAVTFVGTSGVVRGVITAEG
ncbi:MAG: hypothetical protein JWM34_923 [Ilumatobacteraceae bacterium]|nr:hypothetical protein [Ilumatobacteraceae bacterium]